MSSPFVRLYFYFRERKIIFYITFAVVLSLILFFALKINIQEDITAITGGDPKKVGVENIINHIKFTDKLIIRLTLEDTTATADPEKLTRFGKEFCDSLSSNFDSTYIKGIIGNLSDSTMLSAFDILFDHLPLFLDEQDYNKIDSLLTSNAIFNTVAEGYKNLQTPAGFAMKKLFLRDPIGITYLAMNKLKSLKVSDQYEIVDGYIMTKDKRNLLVFITPANPVSETKINQQLLNGIDRILIETNKNYNQEIKGQYFGTIVYGVGNAIQIKKDIYLTVVLACILIIALIGWYYKSWKMPMLGLLPALFGGSLALALMFILQGTVSTIALGIGSVILGLIVDYDLYIINHFRKKGDMVVVLKEMSFTIILCSITTAGAFLCMNFLQSNVLHDLGWFAALSVIGAALFALVFLPQVLNQTDLKTIPERNNMIDRIASFSYDKSYVVGIILLSMLVIAIVFLPQVKFETELQNLNFASNQLKETEKEINKIADVSSNTIYFVSTGGNLNEALKANERNSLQLEKLIKSGVILSVSDCGKLLFSDSLQKLKNEKWNRFWTLQRRQILEKNIRSSAKEFKFREGAFDSFLDLTTKDFTLLNAGETKTIKTGLLSDFFSEDKEHTMITTILKVKNENKGEIYRTFKDMPDLVVFDRKLLTDKFVENVNNDFELLVRLSMGLVTLLLLISFGRIEIGITAALPMFASWIISLGFMGLTGIRFNIFNIVVSTFIFGLGVDYSILMMRGLLFDYRYGTADIKSYKTSITMSSITTLFGVGALFFAKHPALHSIAAISVFGVIVVVIVSFTIQPLLTNWFLNKRRLTNQHPITLWILIRTIITWGNIILVAILQVILGSVIFILFPIPKKKKQYLFHWLFCKLSRVYIITTFPTNRKLFNPHNENFVKPAIIISNHQSLIDTPFFLQLYPKIIILTNEWVWNSPLFGPIAKMGSYYNAENGIDDILEQLKEKVRDGYSILIFPEAHRYNDNLIHRFHRGAFYMAEKLQIDILPIVIFGTGEFLKSGQIFGRPSGIRMKILHRVRNEDIQFGYDYVERSKRIRKNYMQEYSNLMAVEGTGKYYRKKLLLNYIFKGPVLEWYLKVKMKLENYYQSYNELLPRTGEILDLGCGYGFMCYMLSYTSPERKITGVDFDSEKIRIALNGFSKTDNLEFFCDDITKYSFDCKDAIILSDVLHYLTQKSQEEVLLRCMDKISPGGMIIIRDADSDEKKLHLRTKVTELFSTRIIGFNKTEGNLKELYFTSIQKLRKIAEQRDFKVEVITSPKYTSNTLLIIRKSTIDKGSS
jgi:1-acyl-sn-glycerol-3-phosphate acyltransferase